MYIPDIRKSSPDHLPDFLRGVLHRIEEEDGGYQAHCGGEYVAPLRRQSRRLQDHTPTILPTGVGIKGGAEIGAHAARAYWNQPHEIPKAFLKI